MSRGMTSAAIAAVTGEVARACYAVQLEFDGGVSRITTAPHDIVFNVEGSPETFPGVGMLGAISATEESGELASYSLTLTLSAIPRDIISVALTEPYQGRPATVWVVLFDDSWQVVDAPTVIFRGRMDVMVVDLGDTASVTLTCINRLADWERSKMLRYSDEDQRRLHPGDVGCQYAAAMVERTVDWPSAAWFRSHPAS